jgi:hypothetical protein
MDVKRKKPNLQWEDFLKLYFVYDVEIFWNFFCVTFLSEKGKVIFEFSERTKLDIPSYLETLDELQGRFGVSFNGVNYDNIILNKSVEILNSNPEIDYLSFCKELKTLSDIVIYGQNISDLSFIKKVNTEERKQLKLFEEELQEEIKKSRFTYTEEEWYEIVRPYRYIHKWEDVDLLLFWSKNLRMTKQLSLKSIACQLNYPVIQELPIAHDALVILKDIPKIIEYNSIHDTGITKRLMESLREAIEVRLNARSEGFACMSWDAPKIASEALLDDYCLDLYDDNSYEIKRQIRGKRHSFESFIVGDHIPVVNFKTEMFQKMFDVCKASKDGFSYEMIVPFKDYPLKLIYGKGGIHNSFKNAVFKSELGIYQIETSDIASLYPQLIEKLKCFRQPEVLKSYLAKKDYRLTVSKPNVKKAKKENSPDLTKYKTIDEFYKLILNGVSGLLDSPYSWLYNNIPINIARIFGQMILSRLIEECYLNAITVISSNTDGIEVLLKEGQGELYKKIVKDIEEEFGVVFESESYKSIYYANVNNYLAIYPNNNVKEKGSTFLTTPPLGNSNDFLAIPKAVKYILKDGLSIEELFGENWPKYFNIFDFCASYKIAKKYKVLYKGEVQQQLNRFYVSKKGAYLYKQKNTKNNPDNVLKGWAVELLNNYDINKPLKEYSIDFRFYKIKVQEILHDLISNQMVLFDVTKLTE